MDFKEIIMLCVLMVIIIIGAMGFLALYKLLDSYNQALMRKSVSIDVGLQLIRNTSETLTQSLSSYMQIAYTSNLESLIRTLVAFEITRHSKREVMLGKPLSTANLTDDISKVSRNVFESLNHDVIDDRLMLFSRDYLYKFIVEETSIQLYDVIRESQRMYGDYDI